MRHDRSITPGIGTSTYALFGVEDGLESLGSGASHRGGYSNGLLLYTDYRV